MEGIFFARFDDVAGSVVECQASVYTEEGEEEDALDPDLWDRVSEFVIVRKELCDSLLMVSSSGDEENGDRISNEKHVLACPLFLEGPRYPRNTFSFSFGFVLRDKDVENLLNSRDGSINGSSRHTTASTVMAPRGTGAGSLDHVLRKLSHVMRALEAESGFLSRDGASARLQPILRRVLDELCEFGECIVAIDEANTLALKVTPRLIDPPEVLDYEVPITTRDVLGLVSREWDLTFLEVLRYIDGNRHVKLIAELSGVGVALVRRCIRQLLYFRFIRLVDIFQYSNTYICTSKLIELAESEALQRQCLGYVWSGIGAEPPPLARVFQLYAALQPCLSLKDFCLLYDPMSSYVDCKRLVVFGVLHGLVRRVYKFPVLVQGALSREQIVDAEDAGNAEYCSSVQARFDSYREKRDKIGATNGDEKEEDPLDNKIMSADMNTSNDGRERASEQAPNPDPAVAIGAAAKDDTGAAAEAIADEAFGREPGGLTEYSEHFDIIPLLNGCNCIDAICCELWRSPEELEVMLRVKQSRAAKVAIVEK